MESATPEQFEQFLPQYGYTLCGKADRLLNLSFAFLSTLPFCKEVDFEDAKIAKQIADAQMFIAYAMSDDGGGFDPAAVTDGRVVKREELGRDAIVDEYQILDDMQGSDPYTLLKRVPLALGLLNPYLCPGGDVSGNEGKYQPAVFVV